MKLVLVIILSIFSWFLSSPTKTSGHSFKKCATLKKSDLIWNPNGKYILKIHPTKEGKFLHIHKPTIISVDIADAVKEEKESIYFYSNFQ